MYPCSTFPFPVSAIPMVFLLRNIRCWCWKVCLGQEMGKGKQMIGLGYHTKMASRNAKRPSVSLETCTVSQSYPKMLKKLPPVANSLRRFPLKAIVSVSNHLLLFQFHTPLMFTAEGLKEIEESEEIDKEIREIQRSLQKKCCAIVGLRWSHIILQKGSKMAATLWKQIWGGWLEVQGTHGILSKHSKKYKLYQSLTRKGPTTYCCIWKPRSLELKNGIPFHPNNMIVTVVILQTEVPLHF